MKNANLVLLASLLFAGCASLDRVTESQLRPGPDARHWQFEAKAFRIYPESDPKSERMRLDWMATYMKDANACPAKWRVTNRRAIPQSNFGGIVHIVYYDIECT